MNSRQTYALSATAAVLIAAAVAIVNAPHLELDGAGEFPHTSERESRDVVQEWSASEFRRTHTDGRLRDLFASEFLDLSHREHILVNTYPHAYVALPSVDWRTRVGRARIAVKLKEGLTTHGWVYIKLAPAGSADEVDEAIDEILNGNEHESCRFTIVSVAVLE